MQSNTSSGPVEAPVEAPPTLSQGAALWSQLARKMDQRATLDAEIVELTAQLHRSGTIEALEGLPIDVVLSLTHRLPRADRAMQLTAGEVLADMPATRQLFATRCLSWGIVRGIVTQAKRLSREQRGWLDERIAASQDRVAVMDPDDIVDAVAVAAAELRDPRAAQRSEDRVAAGNFVWAQPGLFERGKLYGELDNLSLAAVLGGVDAITPLDDGRSLAQRRADGLVTLALHRCDPHGDTHGGGGGNSGDGDGAGGGSQERVNPVTGEVLPAVRRPYGLRGGRGAVPALSVSVDLADVSVNAAGVISINAPGCLPVLSARVVDALAADASVQVVLFDGGRPLTVTDKIWAKTIPTALRTAAAARDRGDRFPGSRAPAGHAHLHHLDKTGHGHHPEHFVMTSPTSHRRIHRCAWHAKIHPATAAITWTRGQRSWTTLPRGTRLRRPPPRDAGDDPPAA